jgi:competence protein ComEC
MPASCSALGLAALLLGLVWRYLARRTQGSGRAGLPVPGTLPGGFLQHRLAQVLPAELEGVDLQLTGVIVGLPQPGPQGTRFVLRVEQARRDDQPVSVPERVSLGWYRGFDGDGLIAAPVQTLRAGERWLLNVRLRQPHGTLNLGGFDLEL